MHPKWAGIVRLSKRAALIVGVVVLVVIVGCAYGLIQRSVAKMQIASQGEAKRITPATQAGQEMASFKDSRPAAAMGKLVPPNSTMAAQFPSVPGCDVDPQTGQLTRFSKLTGAPCGSAATQLPQERVVVRQAPPRLMQTFPASLTQSGSQSSLTPEEQQLAMSWQQEQAAILAPTSIGRSSGVTPLVAPGGAVPQPGTDPLSTLIAAQALNGVPRSIATGADLTSTGSNDSYEVQNGQSRKEAFLASAHKTQIGDYLQSTREVPLSRFEIKAGWEIPAVLEQGLNSDLPGEVKALVTQNVYDTATGMYLLIHQGSRLVGRYDSHISYGQDGVQVAWSRIIYPDASSVDLDGMAGLDAHGNPGLRSDVDHHYRSLIGGMALTSMFNAAFAITQARNQNVLVINPASAAEAAVGAEVSETRSQLARRNLNRQPTIKVPAGYKFTVRVNRDILFDAPYMPIEADPQALPRTTRTTAHARN
ncbi:MAG TPA: TrbI/VirB10 family protein [Bryobacteraceae bacterium]|nr:TrbI/VirB10 family protein [Bryobacteraceae bacterium]